MKARGQALADIRRAILEGFEQTPGDLKLAVDEASIGRAWANITFGIVGLELLASTQRFSTPPSKVN